eukprot:EG_transcript_31214
MPVPLRAKPPPKTQKTVLSSTPYSAPQPSPPSHWPKGKPLPCPTDKGALQKPGCEDQYELDLKEAIAASLRDTPAPAAVVSNPVPVRADFSPSEIMMSNVQEPGQRLQGSPSAASCSSPYTAADSS